MKRSIFIGCATESLDIAQAIQRNLEGKFSVRIWDQGTIDPGINLIDQLIGFTRQYDFGIFVFSADQVSRIRGKHFMQTAANTIFEAGLFAGVLGKERAFIVSEDKAKLKLPSDFNGIMRSTFVRPHDHDELPSKLATACSDISRAIRKQLDSEERPNDDALAAKKAEVENALQFLCNAIAAPALPEAYGIRAFVFEFREGKLINKYQWSRFNDLERSGALSFDINDSLNKDLAVVRAASSPKPVRELVDVPAQLELSERAPVAPNIRCIVASDIRDSDERVLGVVNLDCVREEGIEVLNSDAAGGVLRAFSELLHRLGAV